MKPSEPPRPTGDRLRRRVRALTAGVVGAAVFTTAGVTTVLAQENTGDDATTASSSDAGTASSSTTGSTSDSTTPSSGSLTAPTQGPTASSSSGGRHSTSGGS